MESTRSRDDIDIRETLQGLRRRAWVVALVVVLAVALALARAGMQKTVYSSVAVVRVLNPTRVAVLGEAGRIDPVREVQIQTLYARSNAVKDATLERLGPRAERIGALTATSVANVDAIRMQATSSSASLAQQGAQTYADVFVEQRRQAVSRLLLGQAERMREEVWNLGAEIGAIDGRIGEVPAPGFDPQGRALGPEAEAVRNLRQQRESLTARQDELNRQASQLALEAAVRQGDTEVVTPAVRPKKPDQPTPFRDAAIAGVVGLFGGLALAIGLARFDDRIRRRSDLEGLVAGVALIPVSVDRRQKRAGGALPLALADPYSPGVEAYRSLRARLLACESDGALSVVVTSPAPGEGKTTTAANLAVVLAGSGRKVIIIDRDLLRPRLHEVFGLSNQRGLSSLLSGKASFEQSVAVVTIPEGKTLDVVTAGPATDNAAELLVSKASAALLSSVLANYDFVIWDTLPLLASADPLSATSRNDGTILVTRSGRTRVHELKDALGRLEQGSARLLAVVLNQAREGLVHVERYQRVAERAPGPVPTTGARSPSAADPARRREGSKSKTHARAATPQPPVVTRAPDDDTRDAGGPPDAILTQTTSPEDDSPLPEPSEPGPSRP